jgi:hypothetical protein
MARVLQILEVETATHLRNESGSRRPMSKLAKILAIPVREPKSLDGLPVRISARREARAKWLLVALVVAGVALFAWGAVMSARQEEDSIRRLARRGVPPLGRGDLAARPPLAAAAT